MFKCSIPRLIFFTNVIILNLVVSSCKNSANDETNNGKTTLPHSTATNSNPLVGTYSVATAKEYEPGERERGGTGKDFYGPRPWGRLILTDEGNYMLTVMVDGIPRFVDSKGKDVGRENGTDEQNRNVVHGSIANFGRYADSSGYLVLKIEKATYPNWDGLIQPRRYRFAEDTLVYEVPNASSGAGRTAEFKWKRIN